MYIMGEQKSAEKKITGFLPAFAHPPEGHEVRGEN
jgi:hypothetical protein